MSLKMEIILRKEVQGLVMLCKRCRKKMRVSIVLVAFSIENALLFYVG